jgi:hypothetical protein
VKIGHLTILVKVVEEEYIIKKEDLAPNQKINPE